jgi:hypothetical protein
MNHPKYTPQPEKNLHHDQFKVFENSTVNAGEKPHRDKVKYVMQQSNGKWKFIVK